MTFTKPVHLGETIRFVSKAIYAGKTRIMTNICLYVKDTEVLNGFITFINVDKDGHSFVYVAYPEMDDLGANF